MSSDLEQVACTPIPVEPNGFNPQAELPYGLDIQHVYHAMVDFVDFLGFVNQQLNTKEIERLESMLMPANFSSMVGEFMKSRIPRYCPSLAANKYHNGHPDLIPKGMFPSDAVQHASVGIEVKASRSTRGWQGHNRENIWLMVFVFDSNRPTDVTRTILPRPFRFSMVVGAFLTEDDWQFSGRSATSRRTITASVKPSGFQKLMANWIYRASKGQEASGPPQSPPL